MVPSESVESAPLNDTFSPAFALAEVADAFAVGETRGGVSVVVGGVNQ
jgi:hypothetical protein